MEQNSEEQLSDDDRIKKKADGFQINWIKLKNAENGTVIWQEATDFSDQSKVHEITLPTEILDIKEVIREISFSTQEELMNFRLVHTAKFKGRMLEQINYSMGSVKKETTNLWISTIYSAPESQMMPAKVLNGKVCIETDFYDDTEKFATSTIKLFYS